MHDFIERLGLLLAAPGDPQYDLDRRVEVLTLAVSNLVDEVMLLRSMVADLQKRSGIAAEEVKEHYRNERMALLFSSAGARPASMFKYQPFLRDAEQTAEALIPDPTERARHIEWLRCLT